MSWPSLLRPFADRVADWVSERVSFFPLAIATITAIVALSLFAAGTVAEYGGPSLMLEAGQILLLGFGAIGIWYILWRSSLRSCVPRIKKAQKALGSFVAEKLDQDDLDDSLHDLAEQLHRFGVGCPPTADYVVWRQFLRHLAPMVKENRKNEARALLQSMNSDPADGIE